MPEFEGQQTRTRGSRLVTPAKPDRAVLQPVYAVNSFLSQQQALGNQAAQRFAQSCPLGLPSPSVCPFGGVCHTCPARVQAKLRIDEPGEKYQHEADRVAEAMMRLPEPPAQGAVPIAGKTELPQIQRVRSEREVEPQRQPIEEEKEEEETLQAKEALDQAPQVTSDVQAQINGIRGGGQPLPSAARAFFEPCFGYDFSQVRIHTDARAAGSARALNARAFTVGRDVVFGAREYVPETLFGQYLLAHELTHVVQQPSDGCSSPTTFAVSSARNAAEREANTVAEKLVTGESPVTMVGVSAPSILHRFPMVGEIAGELVRGYLAYRCLRPLFPQMRQATRTFVRDFCRTLPRTRTESRLRYTGRSMAPRTELITTTLTAVPNNYYDAFGHCWIACQGSRRCGRAATATLGTAREIWRELDQDPHDSFSQDMNNQAYGRQVSDQRGSCRTLCQQAVMEGRLDLSAPIRHCRDCSTRRTTTDCGPGIRVRPERRGEGPGRGWLPPLGR